MQRPNAVKSLRFAVTPLVVEHRFHALACSSCGVSTRAYERSIVDGRRYGDRLCALVGLLSGEYRQSHRMVVRLLAEIFEVELSVGSVTRLRQTMSDAVAESVTEAHAYVQQQKQVNVDETSFQARQCGRSESKAHQRLVMGGRHPDGVLLPSAIEPLCCCRPNGLGQRLCRLSQQ